MPQLKILYSTSKRSHMPQQRWKIVCAATMTGTAKWIKLENKYIFWNGKEFCRAEDQVPMKEICPKDPSKGKEWSLSVKKLSALTKSIGRCTELRFWWLGWQEKLAASVHLQSPNWHLSSGSEALVLFSSQIWKTMQPLHLCQVFNGTFVKISYAPFNMPRTMEPYIAWG